MNIDSNTVIHHLNQALANEFIAIHQYFLHARMYQHWGYQKLGEKTYQESISEMKHADVLISRILFLEGQPIVHSPNASLHIGKDVSSMLQADLALEEIAITALKKGITDAATAGDPISSSLLEDILAKEEEHILWLSTQLRLIENVGLANYLQSQITP